MYRSGRTYVWGDQKMRSENDRVVRSEGGEPRESSVLCRVDRKQVDLRDSIARVGIRTLVEGNLWWDARDGSWEGCRDVGQLEGSRTGGRVALSGQTEAIMLCFCQSL